jgi:hypothetical protein
MQYVPTSANLLATMADLIDNELLPALPGSLQHKARVAANLCRILERQSELEPAAAQREHDLLAGLLGHDGDRVELSAELAGRLRASSDADFDRVAWEAIVAIVRDDLAIAKPGHDVWEGR